MVSRGKLWCAVVWRDVSCYVAESQCMSRIVVMCGGMAQCVSCYMVVVCHVSFLALMSSYSGNQLNLLSDVMLSYSDTNNALHLEDLT